MLRTQIFVTDRDIKKTKGREGMHILPLDTRIQIVISVVITITDAGLHNHGSATIVSPIAN